MDELRLERALRAGPPFATQYVARPLSLREELLTDRAVVTRRTLLLLAVVGLLLAATLAALAIGSLLRPEGTPALSQARSSHTAILLGDGRVLLIGGFRGDELVDSAEVWDPATGLFTPAGSLNQARYAFTATLLADGRVLVVGGTTHHPDSPVRNGLSPVAEIWDPATASFSATSALPEARDGLSAIRLADGRVLVVGGGSADTWDPRTQSFSDAGRWPYSLALLPMDGKVLAVGTPLSSPWGDRGVHVWDPRDGSFSYLGRLAYSHSPNNATWLSDGRATLLSDGRVLVVGGEFTAAEVFDPTTGSSSSAGHLIGQGREIGGFSLTLLLDGRVLILGGGTADGDTSEAIAAQVWDPATSSFQLTGQPEEVRGGHSATPLADGRVLVVGGVGRDVDDSLATAEIWDPATGAFSPAGSTEESGAPS